MFVSPLISTLNVGQQGVHGAFSDLYGYEALLPASAANSLRAKTLSERPLRTALDTRAFVHEGGRMRHAGPVDALSGRRPSRVEKKAKPDQSEAAHENGPGSATSRRTPVVSIARYHEWGFCVIIGRLSAS
jgi:hypothetical protein